MKKKRAVSNTPTPNPGESPPKDSVPTRERSRELDAAIERDFRKLRKLLDEQRADLEALHDLQMADGSKEPPTDPDLVFLIQRWHSLPESVRKQIIDVAKASGISEASDTNTDQEDAK